MLRLLRIIGIPLMLIGLVALVAVASGSLDTWIAENWSCGDGRGRNRSCGSQEGKWSALLLSGAAVFVGWLFTILPSFQGPGSGKAAFTLDLSKYRKQG